MVHPAPFNGGGGNLTYLNTSNVMVHQQINYYKKEDVFNLNTSNVMVHRF